MRLRWEGWNLDFEESDLFHLWDLLSHWLLEQKVKRDYPRGWASHQPGAVNLGLDAKNSNVGLSLVYIIKIRFAWFWTSLRVFVHMPHTFSNYIIGHFIYKSRFFKHVVLCFRLSWNCLFKFLSFWAFKRNTGEGFAVNQINTLVSAFGFLAALFLLGNISSCNVSCCVPNCIHNYITCISIYIILHAFQFIHIYYITCISIFVKANAWAWTTPSGVREAAGQGGGSVDEVSQPSPLTASCSESPVGGWPLVL